MDLIATWVELPPRSWTSWRSPDKNEGVRRAWGLTTVLGCLGILTSAPTALAAETQTDLVEAALEASGYGTGEDRLRARADFERHVGPVVRDLSRINDAEKQAKLLLATLHRKGGLLGRYDPRATTLRDILERRAFNCVSASVLFNLIGHRLKLPVAAQLLPTHARSMLSLERDGRLVGVVIETTSTRGFDPDPERVASILASVAPVDDVAGRALVADGGAIVDTAVLIGTIYVNRASIAQEAGHLERAEQLFARGQRLAPDPSMQRVLSDQRAALLSQLAADDIAVASASRVARALRSLKAAVRLSPSNADVSATIQHNLQALAARWFRDLAQLGDEPGILGAARRIEPLLDRPATRAILRARARSQVATVRLKRDDIDGAVKNLEHGLAEPLPPSELGLRRTLRSQLVSVLRRGALQSAEAGRYAESLRYLKKVEGLPIDDATRDAVRVDRSRVIHLVGELRIGDQDYTGAAEVYRQGLRRDPDDKTSRNNLIVALERLALPLVDEGSCDRAAPYIEEIRKVDEGASFPAEAQRRCTLFRARSRLAAGDFAATVRMLRTLDLSQRNVRQNLWVALLRWAADLAGRGRCKEARARADEAEGLLDASYPAAKAAALAECS